MYFGLVDTLNRDLTSKESELVWCTFLNDSMSSILTGCTIPAALCNIWTTLRNCKILYSNLLMFSDNVVLGQFFDLSLLFKILWFPLNKHWNGDNKVLSPNWLLFNQWTQSCRSVLLSFWMNFIQINAVNKIWWGVNSFYANESGKKWLLISRDFFF